MKNAHLFLAANLLVSTALLPAAESPQRVNLALNKPYAALPAPNDRATMRMADDGAILASDQATKTQQVGRAVLTDGVLSELNAIVYGDPRAVGWLRKGIVQIRIDLGEIHSIGEVALRLQGGMASRPNVFPDQIEVLVSDDGKTFHRVDDFHFWRVGDRKHFELPQETGKPWVYKLRFRDLQTRGRFVGLRICGPSVYSDEVQVFADDHDPQQVKFSPQQELLFTFTMRRRD